MFRRSSKLTAMLVAAAAVVSIVPATAAERLGTKEGNITHAAAFNGGYIYMMVTELMMMIQLFTITMEAKM